MVLDYAKSMGAPVDRIRPNLYSTIWPVAIFVPLEWAIVLRYVFVGATFPGLLRSGLIEESALVALFGSSVLWAFVRSMGALYTLGREPFVLRPFGEDKLLGLEPFGKASLSLVGIYELGILLAAIPSIGFGDFGPTGIPLYVFFALFGFVFFFVPLSGFRRKLIDARKAELAWIVPRYSRIVEEIREQDGPEVGGALLQSLGALKEIRHDAEQIPEWPFDISVFSRLVSITILPMLITVVAREIILVTLHV